MKDCDLLRALFMAERDILFPSAVHLFFLLFLDLLVCCLHCSFTLFLLYSIALRTTFELCFCMLPVSHDSHMLVTW